ncbi:MAG: glycoside hydrolase family 16 protein [Verrucomicrobiota bacterium]
MKTPEKLRAHRNRAAAYWAFFVSCACSIFIGDASSNPQTKVMISSDQRCGKLKLRPWWLLLVGLLLSVIQSHGAPPSGYVLDWSDEFDGSSLDTTKWNYRQLGPRNDAINTESAVSVTNGALTITTYTEGETNFTGMIGTENLYMPLYGYLEARINFNDSPGVWSAFWMTSPTMTMVGDPHAYGTEMDIVEHRAVNSNNVLNHNRAVSNIHWDGYGPEHKSVGSGLVGSGLSTGWHLYAVEWTTNFQNYYYDGVLVWGVTNSSVQNPVPPEAPVSQRSQYFILSSEVRDNGWAGVIPVGGYGSRASSSTKMNVDYVRSYTFSPVPKPVMSAIILEAGEVGISFYGTAGLSYVLERSTNLLIWTNVATNTAPPGGLIAHTNTVTGEAAYYRARSN